MATDNPNAHTLFLVPTPKRPQREFSALQREIESTVARLRDCRHSRERVALLRELRLLIEEADRAVLASKDQKPELQVVVSRKRP